MNRRWFCVFFPLLISVLVTTAAAQQTNEAGGFGFELGLGTVTLPVDPRLEFSPENQQTYQKLALKPDISIGNFGIGLDISLHFNLRPGSDGSDIEFYEPDWVPEKADKSFLELYLPKIAYVRWGHKGDPLYAKLGSFDDGTLGTGFIMSNYANTRFLPENRIFGAALDIDGSLFNFPYIGFESFSGNLANFDVVGARLYARPLVATQIPVLSQLQTGATIAGDLDPLRYAGDEYEAFVTDDTDVIMGGFDLILPLISNPLVNLTAFSDLAFQPEERWGSMLGIGGNLFEFLLYNAQGRLLGPDFITSYFDGSYDLFRHYKYSMLTQQASGSVYAGWLAGLGFSALADTVVFYTSLDGPFSAAPSDMNDAGISDFPHLRATFTLAQGVLAGFSFDALYEKYFLGADDPYGSGNFWEDLISPENAVIGAQINYHTGPAVISLLYNLRYDPVTSDYIVSSSLMSSIRF